MCRKVHGTPFGTFGGYAESGFRFVRGEEGVKRFESSRGNLRTFCGRCGSAVPGEAAQGLVFVPLGGIDGDPGGRPLAHIFAASKAPWHEITDDLPRFDAFPPGYPDPELVAREVPRASAGRIGGSCLCTAVAFEFSSPVDRWHNCYCSRCRRARAAVHASNLFLATDRFTWKRGEDQIDSYKLPEAERFTQSFCRTCGSKVPRINTRMGYVSIPAGSLDDDPGARPQSHIFVDSKVPWHEIRDDLPRHAEFPG
jgi:hypothetical protein